MTDKRGMEAPMYDTSMELRADREIVITRTFRAPPRIVFDAWTKPEHVKRWWAPKSCGHEVVECRADVRVGGEYRYLLRREGSECGFSGTYTEITPPSRLVYTQIFDPFPDSPVIVTVTFEARDGMTHLVSHEVYPSAEARAATLSAGMEAGMRETMEQLAALLASML